MRVGFWNSFSYFYENRLSVFYHAFYYQTLAKIQNFRNFGFRSIPFDSRSFKIRYDYSWLNAIRIRHFKMTHFSTLNRLAVEMTTESHVRSSRNEIWGWSKTVPGPLGQGVLGLLGHTNRIMCHPGTVLENCSRSSLGIPWWW